MYYFNCMLLLLKLYCFYIQQIFPYFYFHLVKIISNSIIKVFRNVCFLNVCSLTCKWIYSYICTFYILSFFMLYYTKLLNGFSKCIILIACFYCLNYTVFISHRNFSYFSFHLVHINWNSIIKVFRNVCFLNVCSLTCKWIYS